MLLLNLGYVVSFRGYKAVGRYRVRTGCDAENNAVKCRAGGDESDVLLLMSDYNPRGGSRAVTLRHTRIKSHMMLKIEERGRPHCVTTHIRDDILCMVQCGAF